MSGHTPGPWRADGQMVYADSMPSVRFGSEQQWSHPFIVTQTALYTDPDRSVAEANARLIAAAPELLEALEMVRDYVVTMKCHGHEYQVAIDAAIDKARGES